MIERAVFVNNTGRWLFIRIPPPVGRSPTPERVKDDSLPTAGSPEKARAPEVYRL